MSSNIVKSFADKTGKSVGEVESLWDKAKSSAQKQLGIDSGDRFHQLTTGILKKMLKLEDGEGGVAPVGPSNTMSTANIAPGDSGVYAAKIGKIKKRRKTKNESVGFKDFYTESNQQ
jgi:hypothetical protein